METWSVGGKAGKNFRFMIYNEQLLYKEQTTMSYLKPLFSPSSSRFPGESMKHFFFIKEEWWKVQSEEKCSAILQGISIPHQNYSEV